MKKPVLLIAKESVGKELMMIIEERGYSVMLVTSVDFYHKTQIPQSLTMVILDLDLPLVTNFFVSQLRKKTRTWIIGISMQQLHPQLEESLRKDLFAVIRKPIDYSELFYCIKCVEDEL